MPREQRSTLQWRHYRPDGVSNHQPHHCLLNRLFRRRSKKTSKLRITGLCVGNSPVTGEFPAQMASNAVTVSIWWRHHGLRISTPSVFKMYSVVLKYPKEHSKTYSTYHFSWADSKQFIVTLSYLRTNFLCSRNTKKHFKTRDINHICLLKIRL